MLIGSAIFFPDGFKLCGEKQGTDTVIRLLEAEMKMGDVLSKAQSSRLRLTASARQVGQRA
jgi:hypothetical protein